MGMRTVILKLTGCTATVDEFSPDKVHAMGTCGGDLSTLCGLPFVDEVKEYAETVNPISCQLCISILDQASRYRKVEGKWK